MMSGTPRLRYSRSHATVNARSCLDIQERDAILLTSKAMKLPQTLRKLLRALISRLALYGRVQGAQP